MPLSFPSKRSDYQLILDSITDGVFTVNSDLRITSFNMAAERITQVSCSEAIGKRCCEVMRAETCESQCCLKSVMENHIPCENVPVYIVRADNRRVPISVNANTIHRPDGELVGGVETFRDLTEIHALRRAYHLQYSFEDIISKNHKMLQLFGILPQVAESGSTVLIQGSSGTGKELIARAIHNHGPRKNAPFVAVNCGALPEALVESELFGYKAGAFTDAKQDKPGRFAAAGEGTLFLDEIGDISAATQVRLLRAIERRTYSPLGSNENVEFHARIIAATHRDLKEMVAEGDFRQDLYFRINVMKLSLPNLAARKEDIPLLVQHFIEDFNISTGKQIMGVSQNALAALATNDWPGNVRELENAIEHAFVLCRGDLIRLSHLPARFQCDDEGRFLPMGAMTLKEIEKQAVINALVRNQWRRMDTSRELAIDKNTLRRKIERYEIKTP
jgi:PAS domain S-box-containing protein